MKVNAVRARLGSPPPRWRPELSRAVSLLLVGPLIAALLVFFVLPLVRLVILSVTEPTPGFDNYVRFFGRPAFTRAAIKTYWLSFVVTGAALLIGTAVAWELCRTRSRFKRIALWSTVLFPLWMSLVVRNYAFTILLQRKGIVNTALQALGLIDQPLTILYTDLAVAVGILYTMLPYAILPLYATFVRIDEDLLWAAESLGASRLRAFASVVIPLALPSFLAAGAIVFVISLGFYITPILLGGPDSQFIATLVSIQIFSLYDVPGAAAVGVLLIVSAILCVGAAWRAVGWERIRRTLA